MTLAFAHPSTPAIIVMGVSGCGKSTLANALATRLGRPLIEGDAYHPASNVAKMAAGQPLTDTDRAPWLAHLNSLLSSQQSVVLSCSALKKAYRAALAAGLSKPPVFVHAHASYDSLLARMAQRSAHFMPASLLRSQFETLEMPTESGLLCVSVPAEHSTEKQVASVLAYLAQQEPEHLNLL